MSARVVKEFDTHVERKAGGMVLVQVLDDGRVRLAALRCARVWITK